MDATQPQRSESESRLCPSHHMSYLLTSLVGPKLFVFKMESSGPEEMPPDDLYTPGIITPFLCFFQGHLSISNILRMPTSWGIIINIMYDFNWAHLSTRTLKIMEAP